MKNIKCLSAAVAAVMLVFAAPVSADATSMSINEQAAALAPGEWLVAPMTGSASDIVTDGSLALTTSLHGDMLAASPYGITGDESVAGLSFPAIFDLFSKSTSQLKNGNFDGTSKSYGNCGHTDDAYGRLLSEGWYGNTPGVAEFTYIGLQAGQTYLVQGFIHDGRDGTKGNKAKIGGVDLQYGDVDGGTWYYGGTFVHVFVPTGSTYKFSIDYSQGAVQMNAVQLRKVTRGVDPFAGKTVRERAAKLRPGEWLAMPMQGVATDIVTEGEINSYNYNMQTYEMAYAKGTLSGDDTVGGVKFRDAKDRLAIDPSIWKNADGLGDCGTTGDYATLLSKAWNADASQTGHAFTYSELKIGQTYLVQIVLHNGKTAANWQQSDGYAATAVVTDGDGTAHVVECGAVNADDRWYYGGTFLHVFTAANTTYSFNVKFYKDDTDATGGLLNAIQLRKVERASKTIAEMAAELASGEWMAAPLTGDPSDVLTMGEPVTYAAGNEIYTNAYAAGANDMTEAGHASVGGIAFANGFYKNLSVDGGAWADVHGACGLTGDYAKLLDSLYFKDDVHELTFTIGGNHYPSLEVGEDYVIQLFFHSAYAGGGQDWTQDKVTADMDKTVQFGAASAGDDWYYGGTLVHRFTAETSSYSFTLAYSGHAAYNAFVIRKIVPPIEPVAPSFELEASEVENSTATISLGKVVKGTDSTGETKATTYDVFAYAGDDPAAATERASDQSGATASFQVSDLPAGTSVYHVYIVNDQGVSSVTNTVKVKNVQTVNKLARKLKVGDWLAVPMTGSPDDIATIGEISMAGNSPMAYAKDGPFSGDKTVNGVLFRDSKENLELDPNIWTNQGNDKDCGTSGDYKTIMTKFWGSQTASGPEGTSFTYSDLDPNKTYLVQIILHNGRDDQFGKGYQYAATAGGETVYFSSETSDGEWYYGGTLLHVFKPDQDGNYTFHVFYTKTTDGSIISAQLNAIQLRDITPVLTIAEQAAALTAADGWLGLQMTGEASDFATKGELVFAYSATATEAGSDVANVPFAIREDWTKFNAGSNTGPAGGVWYRELDKSGTDYGKILSNGYTGGTPNTDNAFKVMGLTAGETYLIQMIIHNGRGTDSSLGGSWTDEYLGTATAGGQQVQYGAAAKGDAWYYGGTLIKVFTADTNGEFAFNVTYGARDPQWNAVQVRHLASYIHGSSGFILIVR